MKPEFKYITCIGLGILAEIALCLIALVFTFAGHGSAPLPRFFTFLTPYYFLLSPKDSTSLLASIITMFQMPFYGWFLANGWVNKRYGEHFVILACFHIVAAFISYWIQGKK